MASLIFATPGLSAKVRRGLIAFVVCAVERCYRPEPFHSDRGRVEHLFRVYEQLTAPLLPATPSTGSRRRKTDGAASPARPRRGRTLGLSEQS